MFRARVVLFQNRFCLVLCFYNWLASNSPINFMKLIKFSNHVGNWMLIKRVTRNSVKGRFKRYDLSRASWRLWHNVEQSCAVWMFLQLLYDRRTRPTIYRRTLNHVLNWATVLSIGNIEWQVSYTIFCMARAARATEVACDSRKQKPYRVNRPIKRKQRVVIFDNFSKTVGKNLLANLF